MHKIWGLNGSEGWVNVIFSKCLSSGKSIIGERGEST